MIRPVAHVLIVTILTIISQLGGVAWLLAMRFKRKGIVILIAFCSLSVSAMWVASVFGRDSLPCVSDDGFRMQSALYCALNRQYVVPELREALRDLQLVN